MALSNKKGSLLVKRVLHNIGDLKLKGGEHVVGKTVGIIYLLATILAMKEMEMQGREIFINDYYFENEEGRDFSRKFLSKRLRILDSLLKEFNSFRSEEYEANLSRREKELSDYLLEFEDNERINWLNENGLYTFYRMIKEGVVSYSELGKKIEELMLSESNRYKSNQQ